MIGIAPVPLFQSETGINVPAVTTAQMKEIDRIAIEETGPNLFRMMENAGSSLARCAFEMLGTSWQKSAIVVLVGSGGNGGGGICAARHLANHGIHVRVCLADPDTKVSESAFQRHILRSTSAREVSLDDLSSSGTDLIIDALVGYGLLSAPRGNILNLIRWVGHQSVPLLALDVPSGIDATTGDHPGEFVHADRTMTLALPKTGLKTESAGELFLADIGIPGDVYQRLKIDYVSPFDARSIIGLKNIG